MAINERALFEAALEFADFPAREAFLQKAITDAGLEMLAACKSLGSVDLRNCPKITSAGVAKLQSAFPTCKMQSDHSFVPGPSTMVVSPQYEWSEPVSLGPNINTEAREATPSLTDDELLLVFARDGRGMLLTSLSSDGEKNTWHAKPMSGGAFQPGVPLQPPFDASRAGCLVMPSDGTTIYFHSRSIEGGAGDLDLWMCRRVPKR